MSDLTDFLLARIAEDEAVAREATPGEWYVVGTAFDRDWMQSGYVSSDSGHEVTGEKSDAVYGPDCALIARFQPARVLAECEAKRRVVEWCGERVRVWVGDRYPGTTSEAERPGDYVPGKLAHLEDSVVLRLLALPYADHPEYRDEWRP